MKKLFLFFLFMLSINVHAGYQCEVSLAHTEDNLIMATKMIHASDKDMKSAFLENFFLDHDMAPLNLKIFISGWSGEEEISATVLKNSKEISEKLSLRGKDKGSMWFNSYKLILNCSLV